MPERIAVETMTLKEVAAILFQSVNTALPWARKVASDKLKKLTKAKVSSHKWSKSYEIVKGAELTFYYQKIASQEQPIVSVAMTHRTPKGMILMVIDTANGASNSLMNRPKHWDKSVIVYTSHYCERYAQRIMAADAPTFSTGVTGIMYADIGGVIRVLDTVAEGVEEVAFQFKEGQAFGYRDRKSKVSYFRTVYSNDMLRGEKSDFREEWKESVAELNEWFKWK